MFLDSDDWWYSQKIEKQINIIINDDTNFVAQTGYRKIMNHWV